ncbi:MAG TPA: T9SS type A sorting domain-containing protein, partial [Chitinophagales bacterium]|nr:T9SS type A sorting domain-containing protein [Chitinophagales bacterium]
NGETQEDLTNLLPDDYGVTVTDAVGNTSSLEVTILFVPGGLNAVMTPSDSITSCHMAFNVTLTVSPLPNVVYAFRRINANGSTSTLQQGTDNTFQPNSPGTWSYYAVAVDTVTGCMDVTDLVFVTLSPLPPPTFTAGPCVNGELTFTGSPTDPSYAYQWLMNLAPIAGATNAVYTTSQIGAFRFRVTDSCGVVKLSDSVYYNSDCFFDAVPAAPWAEANGVHLFPNPNAGTFDVEALLQSAGTGKITLQLVDVMGRVVWEQPLQLLNGYGRTNVKINGLSSGVYVLRTVTPRTTLVNSFVISR